MLSGMLTPSEKQWKKSHRTKQDKYQRSAVTVTIADCPTKKGCRTASIASLAIAGGLCMPSRYGTYDTRTQWICTQTLQQKDRRADTQGGRKNSAHIYGLPHCLETRQSSNEWAKYETSNPGVSAQYQTRNSFTRLLRWLRGNHKQLLLLLLQSWLPHQMGWSNPTAWWELFLFIRKKWNQLLLLRGHGVGGRKSTQVDQGRNCRSLLAMAKKARVEEERGAESLLCDPGLEWLSWLFQKKKNILQACIVSGYIDFLYFVRTSSFTSTIDTAVSRNTFYLPLLIISVSIFFVSSEAGLTAGFLACDATLSSVCTRCGVKIDQEWMNGWFRLRPSVMARRCGSIILLIRVSAPKPQGCTRSAALCNLLQVPTSIFKIYMGNDQKRVLYPGIIPGRFRAKKRAQRRTKSNAQPTSHAIWARATRTRFWSEKLKAPF